MNNLQLFNECKHEDWCSQTNRYWRTLEDVEIRDGNGQLIERVLGDEKLTDSFFCCTECGAEAHYVKVKSEKKNKSKEPDRNRQEVLL